MTTPEPEPERTLPIRVPILPGESLDSWLEAVARRLGMTVRQLLPALGLSAAPRVAYTLVFGLPPEHLRRVERQAGLPEGRLDEAVLGRFLSFRLVSGQRRGDPPYRWQRWATRSGARFCPRCLAASHGRWQLRWYLNWSFACLRHHVILATCCPRCGGIPRTGEARWDHTSTSERCGHVSPDARGHAGRGGPRCAAELATQPVAALGHDHPLVHTQRWIDDLVGLTVPTPANDTVTLAGMAVPRPNAIDAVATLIRHGLTANADPTVQTVSQRSGHRRPADGLRLPGHAGRTGTSGFADGAASPALFGVVAALAVDALTAPTLEAAAAAIAWMLPPPGSSSGKSGGPRPAFRRHISNLPEEEQVAFDPVIDAILLRGQAPDMRISHRLAFRTQNPIPRRPLATNRNTPAAPTWPHISGRPASVPARLIPQRAWRSVTDALPSHAAHDAITFPTIVAMAIVRTGTSTPWPQVGTQLELPRGLPERLAHYVGHVWRRLTQLGSLTVFLAGIDALVDALLERPPPIDYARRRWVFRDLAPVAPGRFRRACHTAGLPATPGRHRYVSMLLWEMLTGGDIRLHCGQLKPRDHHERSRFATFCTTDAEVLAGYLAEEAERHLLRHRINEPVTWQPELDDPTGPTWRSPAPDRRSTP